jgi:hypothetical protein
MPQRKSVCRWGQACPAGLLIAKSAEAEKAGATQHSPKQRSQSARRVRRSPVLIAVAAALASRRVRGPRTDHAGPATTVGWVASSPRAQHARPCARSPVWHCRIGAVEHESNDPRAAASMSDHRLHPRPGQASPAKATRAHGPGCQMNSKPAKPQPPRNHSTSRTQPEQSQPTVERESSRHKDPPPRHGQPHPVAARDADDDVGRSRPLLSAQQLSAHRSSAP